MARQSDTPTNDPPYPIPKAGNPNAPNYLENARGAIIIDAQTGKPATFSTGTFQLD